MNNGIEKAQMRVALLKAPGIYPESFGSEISHFCAYRRIIHIPDLKDDLVKDFLLISVKYLLIVVRDTSVLALLLCIVFSLRFIEQLVIYLLDVIIDDGDVVTDPVLVNISRDELTIIVVDVSFADLSAYCTLHISHTPIKSCCLML